MTLPRDWFDVAEAQSRMRAPLAAEYSPGRTLRYEAGNSRVSREMRTSPLRSVPAARAPPHRKPKPSVPRQRVAIEVLGSPSRPGCPPEPTEPALRTVDFPHGCEIVVRVAGGQFHACGSGSSAWISTSATWRARAATLAHGEQSSGSRQVAFQGTRLPSLRPRVRCAKRPSCPPPPGATWRSSRSGTCARFRRSSGSRTARRCR